MKELIQAVKLMRELQKKYFRTRDREVLSQSKEAEKRVDAIITELTKEKGLFE